MPRLWTYFVLDQILPISFTQNLFCTTMALSAVRRTYHRQPFMTLSTVRITALISYVVLLFSISSSVHTRWFFPNLFALRMLLFAPFLIDHFAFRRSNTEQPRLSKGLHAINTYCLLALALCGAYSIFFDNKVILTTSTKSSVNYAAAALSNDLFIGIVSGLVYAVSWTT